MKLRFFHINILLLLFTNSMYVFGIEETKVGDRITSNGITPDLLANCKGAKIPGTTFDVNYAQTLQKVEELVAKLPKQKGVVENLDKYIGSSGFGVDNIYTIRTSFVQADLLVGNQAKIANTKGLIFEKPTSNPLPDGRIVNSVTDIEIRLGDRIIQVETKAGDRFFNYVTSEGSNFSRQSFNMLRDASSIGDIKIPLNPDLRALLDESSTMAAYKKAVVKAWKDWENGAIFRDEAIRDRFIVYFDTRIQSIEELEELLLKNDNWFESWFKFKNL